MSLTPLYVPPSRLSPRPPGEPLRPPELHRHRAAAIDAERLRLAEERRALEKEREEFKQQQQAAARVVRKPPAPEQPRPAEPKRAETLVPLGPADPATTAAAIVRAGQIRRNELVPKPPPPRTEAEKMAAMIVSAAAKARSIGPPPELPEDPLARAIILCGQKARGTIDAAGERWLSDFLGKVESTRELMQ